MTKSTTESAIALPNEPTGSMTQTEAQEYLTESAEYFRQEVTGAANALIRAGTRLLYVRDNGVAIVANTKLTADEKATLLQKSGQRRSAFRSWCQSEGLRDDVVSNSIRAALIIPVLVDKVAGVNEADDVPEGQVRALAPTFTQMGESAMVRQYRDAKKLAESRAKAESKATDKKVAPKITAALLREVRPTEEQEREQKPLNIVPVIERAFKALDTPRELDYFHVRLPQAIEALRSRLDFIEKSMSAKRAQKAEAEAKAQAEAEAQSEAS